MQDQGGVPEYIFQDRFAEHLGIQIMEVASGHAKTRVRIEQHHLNGLGTTHGALIFALADCAFAAISNFSGRKAVAVHTDISFIKPSTLGDELWAIAAEEKSGKKMGFYRITVTNVKGEIIALFSGVVSYLV